MRAGSLILCGIVLLACGCEQLDPYRQGIVSNYRKELRELGEEVNLRTAAAKTTPREDDPPAAPEGVTQAAGWSRPSLLSAIQLNPPVPYDARSLGQ